MQLSLIEILPRIDFFLFLEKFFIIMSIYHQLCIHRFDSTQSQMKHNFSKFLNDFSDKNILTDDSGIREEHSQRIQERLLDLDSLTG